MTEDKECREEFELWARDNGYVVTRALDGEWYSQQGTDRAWDVWQAAWRRAAKPAVPVNYVDYQQRRGAHADIVDEAIAAYEQWLLDDDYDPHGALKRIIERMRERRALYAAPPLPVAQGVPPFSVRVSKMVESHRETYWVMLERSDRPKDASILDDAGRISPYYSEIKARADETAQEWAEFLGVSVAAPMADDTLPHLIDRGDAVKGHYCIGRRQKAGEPWFEFWNGGQWHSAGEVFVGKKKAETALKKLLAAAPKEPTK